MYRERLQLWVREALAELGGAASVNDVARQIWLNHEADLRNEGEHFYSWQYDIRWAAQKLRETGKAGLRKQGSKSIWYLKQ
ncbi:MULTISPECIES: hypothetical protein [Sphingomonas]|uniref:hypothetical protein n=1 Tax=Sphingomonas TaxID=13687 RepID=UPI00082AA0F7|nr:hypothetical protein [Sphingomonas sp. CCH10-B3]